MTKHQPLFVIKRSILKVGGHIHLAGNKKLRFLFGGVSFLALIALAVAGEWMTVQKPPVLGLVRVRDHPSRRSRLNGWKP